MGVTATGRVTGKSKTTILKLLADVGEACAAYQDRMMRDLKCYRLELDEVWSFVGAKEKNARKADPKHETDNGDVYTFTAIDPDTKLMSCWLVGIRDRNGTFDFCADLAQRVEGRTRITTDSWSPYPDAVSDAFGPRVDHVVLNKDYDGGAGVVEGKRRYRPPSFVKATKIAVSGNPDLTVASTSIVERSNLALRMGNRRFTRLTNAFSKKLANHMHAISFYFMVYNFVKVHSTIKTTPAIEAGVTDYLWSMEDIVVMSETNS